MLDDKEIERILVNAKASLSFENMDVDDDMVELLRKHLEGKLSKEKVLEIIKNKALKKD